MVEFYWRRVGGFVGKTDVLGMCTVESKKEANILKKRLLQKTL